MFSDNNPRPQQKGCQRGPDCLHEGCAFHTWSYLAPEAFVIVDASLLFETVVHLYFGDPLTLVFLLFLWSFFSFEGHSFFCLRVSPWLALCLSQHSPYGVSFMLLAFTIMNVLLTPRVKSPAHFSLQNPRLIYSIISRIILNPYPIAYKKSIFPNSSLWHSTWHKLGAQMFFVNICIRVACFLDQLHQTVNILWARIASFSKPVSSPASSIVSVT